MNKPEKWIVRFEKHLSMNLIVGWSPVDIYQLDEMPRISYELLFLNKIVKLNVSLMFHFKNTVILQYNHFPFFSLNICYNSPL